MPDSWQPSGLQHVLLPCPSPSPGVCSHSCSLSQWCHPAISCSVAPFSSCPQSFPASGSFPISQLFSSGGQGIGVSASASVLPMNIQGWIPLGLTGLISLRSRDSLLLTPWLISINSLALSFLYDLRNATVGWSPVWGSWKLQQTNSKRRFANAWEGPPFQHCQEIRLVVKKKPKFNYNFLAIFQ